MRVFVDVRDFDHRYEILFYEKRGDIMYVAEPINLVFHEVKNENRIEPTLTVYDRGQFIQDFADIAEKMNFKTKNQLDKEHKYEGVLEATKFHLLDMREIVFKKLTI